MVPFIIIAAIFFIIVPSLTIIISAHEGLIDINECRTYWHIIEKDNGAQFCCNNQTLCNKIVYFSNMPRLKFSQFQNFYNVNPEAWNIFENGNEPEIWLCPWRYEKYQDEVYAISWESFKEFKQYYRWAKKQRKLSMEIAENKKQREILAHKDKNLEEILKLVQHDIDEAQANLAKAVNDTVELLNKERD